MYQRTAAEPAGGVARGSGADGGHAADRDQKAAGSGTNPEQLFAVGYAACFEGALAVVGRRQKLEAGDASIDSKVNLLPTSEGGFELSVELHVTLPSIDDTAQAIEVVEAAHHVCPYSNATRGNIDVTLTANGQTVG